MGKWFLIGVLPFLFFCSCKDDDGGVTLPALNKMTRVYCYVDGNSEPKGSLELIYNSSGNLDQMKVYNGSEYVRSYHYRIGTSTVDVNYTDFSNGVPVHYSPEAYRSFTLGSGRVGTERIKAFNDRAGSAQETYIKDVWSYVYSGSLLSGGSWVYTKPTEDGGYITYPSTKALTLVYRSGVLNSMLYITTDTEFSYSEILTPTNFPLRFVRPIDLDSWDLVDPLNFYYGTMGKLPAKARVTDIGNESAGITEFTFDYRTLNEYVTEMFVTRVYNGVSSVYRYVFEYNYEVSSF